MKKDEAVCVNLEQSLKCHMFSHLVGCTLHSPCGPSLWLFLQTTSVKGHGQRPGGFHWSCRTSGWGRGRLPPLGQLRSRCIGAPDWCLSRSIFLGLSGSWTASRKAAAPSPVPFCLHAGYPTPSPLPRTLSRGALTTGLFHSFFLPLPLLLFTPPVAILVVSPPQLCSSVTHSFRLVRRCTCRMRHRLL